VITIDQYTNGKFYKNIAQDIYLDYSYKTIDYYYNFEKGILKNLTLNGNFDKSAEYIFPEFENLNVRSVEYARGENLYEEQFNLLTIYEYNDAVSISSIEKIISASPNVILINCIIAKENRTFIDEIDRISK